MLKLYMHCGGHHVDREAAVTTPTPQRTRTWVPVPHGRLLGLVEQTLFVTVLQLLGTVRSRWIHSQRGFNRLDLSSSGSSVPSAVDES